MPHMQCLLFADNWTVHFLKYGKQNSPSEKEPKLWARFLKSGTIILSQLFLFNSQEHIMGKTPIHYLLFFL
jgi:hypothetical protein